jgi:hypothetical protein
MCYGDKERFHRASKEDGDTARIMRRELHYRLGRVVTRRLESVRGGSEGRYVTCLGFEP